MVTAAPRAATWARATCPRVRLTGALEQVRPAPAGRGPALRAELGGEAGRLTIIWLGRTHITGIEPGRVLAVEGTLSRQRGRKVMYNPRYELLAPQARAGHRRSP